MKKNLFTLNTRACHVPDTVSRNPSCQYIFFAEGGCPSAIVCLILLLQHQITTCDAYYIPYILDDQTHFRDLTTRLGFCNSGACWETTISFGICRIPRDECRQALYAVDRGQIISKVHIIVRLPWGNISFTDRSSDEAATLG